MKTVIIKKKILWPGLNKITMKNIKLLIYQKFYYLSPSANFRFLSGLAHGGWGKRMATQAKPKDR